MDNQSFLDQFKWIRKNMPNEPIAESDRLIRELKQHINNVRQRELWATLPRLLALESVVREYELRTNQGNGDD